MDQSYSATKTRSGRPGWSVIFRHPLRTDARGKPGLKVRRGLKTNIDEEADELVAQLNGLLSDQEWWSPDRRGDAERQFAPQIVSAFFDGIEAARTETAQLRDRLIQLPDRNEGYAKVLLVGTTGAGKTTLLRHLIGANHERDRFPSTSTARTTISDTEIVLCDGPFAAAVTFMSEFEARAHIDECIEAACLAAIEGQSEGKISAALLTHREQRFRLSYVLGELESDTPLDEDDFSFDPKPATSALDDQDRVVEDERRANSDRIKGYVSRLRILADVISRQNGADHGSLSDQQTPGDKVAWLELFSDRLFDSDDLAQLSLDIRDDIESRFELLDTGELERSASGWPVLWTYETNDRVAFLRQVRWFSSNHSQQFGRLLTPLVDGVRVRGPFYPERPEFMSPKKLVLLDGQGLGHTAESASSVSTRVTKRFGEVDMILLVDNAQHPMQAAPLALLRAAGSAGCADKLAVAFTHFDHVKGDNLETPMQRRAHVVASIGDALVGLRQLLGATVATALQRRLEERVFLLGALDREIEQLPGGVLREIGRLLSLLQSAAMPGKAIDSSPIYTADGLELALRDAVESFLRPWEARLGLTYRDGIRIEHWTRPKALSRRVANGWNDDEYDTLKPKADLLSSLQEEISRWLDSPAGWTRIPRDEDERSSALNHVRSAVFSSLQDLVGDRLAVQRRRDWMNAYVYSGSGSTSRRANEIRRIFEESAPPISSAMKPHARAFLTEVVEIVRSSVRKSGGQFEPSPI